LWLFEPVLYRVSSTAVVKRISAEGTAGEALGWHFFGYFFVATDKKATRPQGESS